MDLNPVSCAGALEVIHTVEKQDLVSRSRQVGAYLLEKLHELLEFDIIGDVRGKGLMCGFELVKDKATKEPFPPASKVSLRFQDEAMRRGLVLFQCTGCIEGTAGDMMLVTPPLIITREQVDDMIAILKEAQQSTAMPGRYTRVRRHRILFRPTALQGQLPRQVHRSTAAGYDATGATAVD